MLTNPIDFDSELEYTQKIYVPCAAFPVKLTSRAYHKARVKAGIRFVTEWRVGGGLNHFDIVSDNEIIVYADESQQFNIIALAPDWNNCGIAYWFVQ